MILMKVFNPNESKHLFFLIMKESIVPCYNNARVKTLHLFPGAVTERSKGRAQDVVSPPRTTKNTVQNAQLLHGMY